MREKTPTAEEVLDHYREYMELVAEWESAAPDDAAAELAPQIALVRFEDALKQHDESRGPVTREWFMERFGSATWNGGDCELTATSTRIIFAVRADGDQWKFIPLRDPTREDIERLVRMLGGSAD